MYEVTRAFGNMSEMCECNFGSNLPCFFPASPETAFLGPKLWKNPITTLPEMLGQTQSHQRQQAEPTASGANAEFMSAEFMNIDDFLLENDFSSQGKNHIPLYMIRKLENL